jgi:hypothetical protein
MQQQVQVQQPAQQVVQEGVSFFSRRGAKVVEQDDRGFRMSLAGDGGRVTVTPTVEGGSIVTVEAEGLGVMALADQFVRDLRKQSRLQARNGERPARAGGAVTLRGGFGDLRERLGMPAPPRPEPAGEPEAPGAAALPTQRPAHRRGRASQGMVPSAEGVPPAEETPPEAVLATPPSAEQTGGVPSPADAEGHTPSASAYMASGAGSPASPPVVDPSTSPPGQPAIEGISQLSQMPEGEPERGEKDKPEHEAGA